LAFWFLNDSGVTLNGVTLKIRSVALNTTLATVQGNIPAGQGLGLELPMFYMGGSNELFVCVAMKEGINLDEYQVNVMKYQKPPTEEPPAEEPPTEEPQVNELPDWVLTVAAVSGGLALIGLIMWLYRRAKR